MIQLIHVVQCPMSSELFYHSGGSPSGKSSDKSPGNRVFEMRTYYTHPGKLSALNKRFREHNNAIFVKHGMSLVGYWIPEGSEDTLVYILAYSSKEAQRAAWKAFGADPNWKKAFADSNGVLVKKWIQSFFRQPTIHHPVMCPSFSLKTHPNDVTLLVALLAGLGFVVAYHTYGRWLGRRIFELSAKTACQILRLKMVSIMSRLPKELSSVIILLPSPVRTDRRPRHRRDVGMGPALLWVVLGSIFIGGNARLQRLWSSILQAASWTDGGRSLRAGLMNEVRLLFLFITLSRP